MSKTIFISGGSRGIGWAIAKRFYAEGFTVAICGREENSLARAKQELPLLYTFACDVSDKQQVQNLAKTLVEKLGKIDVLVNNAGVFLSGSIASESDEQYEKVITTNLHSAYYLTKALLPNMMAQKSGTIFNMCSVASIRPYENGGSYCISKYAMLGFGKVLREEMKPHNIRVMNVLPGAVLTDSWAGADLPESRFIPTEDIAEIIWSHYQLSPKTVVEEIIIRPFLGDI